MANGGYENEVQTVAPDCSVCEEGDKIFVNVEMPGVDKKDVTVEVNGDTLEISGKRQKEKIDGEYIVRERNYTDFYKAFTLDEHIDRNAVKAKMQNGILTVTLQVQESAKPRKIKVEEG